MADFKRNEIEMEMDRADIAAIVLHAGRDLSAVVVTQIVNRRRAKRARAAALDAGKTPEEAEEAAAYSKLTVWSVRRDLRVLNGRAQEAGLVAAALILDDQISAVRDEIQATHDMDEAILQDLERSRAENWTRTRSERVNGAMEAGAEVRHAGDGAANASLYKRLQDNVKLRADLRAEERLLRFGRQAVPESTIEDELTYAEIVMQLDDPEGARSAAEKLIRREVRDLAKAAHEPLAGDMIRMELARTQIKAARIRSLREYMRLPDGEGESGAYEVVFQEIPVRALPAGPDKEGTDAD